MGGFISVPRRIQSYIATIQGVRLLDKCNNPACRASFRYLNEGRLFRIENDSNQSTALKKSEYFWLCGKCALDMSLRLADDATVQMVPVCDRLRPARTSFDFVAVDRKDGLVLTCLNFTGERVPVLTWVAASRERLLYAG